MTSHTKDIAYHCLFTQTRAQNDWCRASVQAGDGTHLCRPSDRDRSKLRSSTRTGSRCPLTTGRMPSRSSMLRRPDHRALAQGLRRAGGSPRRKPHRQRGELKSTPPAIRKVSSKDVPFAFLLECMNKPDKTAPQPRPQSKKKLWAQW